VSTSFGKRIKPGSEAHHGISNFTTDNYAYNINPNLEGEFIFLDEEERRRFALNDHEYLITQSRLTEKDGVQITSTVEETGAKLLPAFNPVKYITWVIKRDDLKHLNDWNNYSNWVYEDIPPYSNQYAYETMAYNVNGAKHFFYSTKDSHGSLYTEDYLKRNILTNVRIEFDGINRIDKDAHYFEKQQVYQHFKTKPKDGIYVYSFSLNPTEMQPSGSCNFSNIQVPKIYFKRNIVTGFSSYYNHRAYIYIISYNILVIKNGIGSLKFVN
jgi:hypothetical protein